MMFKKTVGITTLPIYMQRITHMFCVPEIQPRAKTDLLVQCFDREAISKSQFQGKYVLVFLCNAALGLKIRYILSAVQYSEKVS